MVINMAPVSYKQDMPPKGGYSPITFHRIPAKKFFGTYGLFAGFLGMTAVAFYVHTIDRKRIRFEELEMTDARIALEPILTAERERAYLKHILAMRNDEAELMKNVPGWEVGTYYGEPIYKTVDRNKWIDPLINEYYGQCNLRDYKHRMFYTKYR